ncbi:MAG: hypothetical protein KDC98_14115 [Planctomycetes bacterium]|nr:hypothetical protein [Planctomycetota bacterium]
MPRHSSLVALAAVGCSAAAALAQNVAAPFQTDYLVSQVGPTSTWPGGALTFAAGNPGTLLLGANPGTGSAIIAELPVTRDVDGHVTGVVAPITQVTNVGYMGTSMVYGPGGVLFYTTSLTNELWQIAPGNWLQRRQIDLAQFGMQAEYRGCAIVPAGFANAGELRIVSDSGSVHAFTLTPDGNGTFDLALARPPVTLGNGPRNLVHVPPGSALLPDHEYALVTEYVPGQVVLYRLDANAMPIPSTRQPFLAPLGYPAGSCIDPITGDLLQLSHGWGSVDLVRVTGFGRCGSQVVAGFGIAGTHGAPTIAPSGCAGRNEVWSARIENGLANAPGFVIVGIDEQSLPVLNGTLYVQPLGTFFHYLDASGRGALSLTMPRAPVWNGLGVHAQAIYLDPAAMFGISATNALHCRVR